MQKAQDGEVRDAWGAQEGRGSENSMGLLQECLGACTQQCREKRYLPLICPHKGSHATGKADSPTCHLPPPKVLQVSRMIESVSGMAMRPSLRSLRVTLLYLHLLWATMQ